MPSERHHNEHLEYCKKDPTHSVWITYQKFWSVSAQKRHHWQTLPSSIHREWNETCNTNRHKISKKSSTEQDIYPQHTRLSIYNPTNKDNSAILTQNLLMLHKDHKLKENLHIHKIMKSHRKPKAIKKILRRQNYFRK